MLLGMLTHFLYNQPFGIITHLACVDCVLYGLVYMLGVGLMLSLFMTFGISSLSGWLLSKILEVSPWWYSTILILCGQKMYNPICLLGASYVQSVIDFKATYILWLAIQELFRKRFPNVCLCWDMATKSHLILIMFIQCLYFFTEAHGCQMVESEQHCW